MRSFILLFALIWCTGLAATAQSSAKSSTHQAIVTDGVKTVRFNIDPSLVEVRSTRSTRVMVESNITMNASAALLDYTMKTGRYDLVPVTVGDVMTISPAERKQTIIIRGEIITEDVTYVIYVPEHLEQKIAPTVVE